MQRPSFLVAYLAGGLILATPPAAAAQHMGHPPQMGQQHQTAQQEHTQDMIKRLNAIILSLGEKNAGLASRVERTQGGMREHQEIMLRVGQAMAQMAAQMRDMMEGMQGMEHEGDVVMDQEALRAMNQFQEHLSSVMRQMEGPMRALHQMRGH